VEVSAPSADALGAGPGEASAPIRARVLAARERQAARLGSGRCNAEASVAEIRRDAALDRAAEDVLARGQANLGLSGRGYDRVLRLARTLADLADRGAVAEEDVGEALTLRSRADE
jgi:magnesium chelatase family protein